MNEDVKNNVALTKRNLVLRLAENKKLKYGGNCFVNCPFCSGNNTLFISKAYNGRYTISCTNCDYELME